MLGIWIAFVCVILGGLAFAFGLASNAGGYFILGLLFFIGAGIGGSKGRFVHHDGNGLGH